MSAITTRLQALNFESQEIRQAIIDASPQRSTDISDYYDIAQPKTVLSPRSVQDSNFEPYYERPVIQPRTSSMLLEERCNEEQGLADPSIDPVAITLKLVRKICEVDCTCKCHESFRSRTPRMLDSIFGSLFLGYEASPFASRSCQNPYCGRSSTTLSYTFPRWFVNRPIAFTMISHQLSSGPEMLLRISQVRPGDSRIFICAHDGYLEEAQSLLETRQASVADTNTYGATALSVSNSVSLYKISNMFVRLHLHIVEWQLLNYYYVQALTNIMKMR